jgi:hypothetical protein
MHDVRQLTSKADRSEPDDREGISCQIFEVLGQSPTAASEHSLGHPAPRENLETFRLIEALGDLSREMRQDLFLGLMKLRSLVAATGEELLQERMWTKQGRQQQRTAVAMPSRS